MFKLSYKQMERKTIVVYGGVHFQWPQVQGGRSE